MAIIHASSPLPYAVGLAENRIHSLLTTPIVRIPFYDIIRTIVSLTLNEPDNYIHLYLAMGSLASGRCAQSKGRGRGVSYVFRNADITKIRFVFINDVRFQINTFYSFVDMFSSVCFL